MDIKDAPIRWVVREGEKVLQYRTQDLLYGFDREIPERWEDVIIKETK